jgi:hypothetical protein
MGGASAIHCANDGLRLAASTHLKILEVVGQALPANAPGRV